MKNIALIFCLLTSNLAFADLSIGALKLKDAYVSAQYRDYRGDGTTCEVTLMVTLAKNNTRIKCASFKIEDIAQFVEDESPAMAKLLRSIKDLEIGFEATENTDAEIRFNSYSRDNERSCRIHLPQLTDDLASSCYEAGRRSVEKKSRSWF